MHLSSFLRIASLALGLLLFASACGGGDRPIVTSVGSDGGDVAEQPDTPGGADEAPADGEAVPTTPPVVDDTASGDDDTADVDLPAPTPVDDDQAEPTPDSDSPADDGVPPATPDADEAPATPPVDSDDTTESPTPPTSGGDDLPAPPPADPEPIVTDGWERVDPMVDLLGPTIVQPEELLIAADGQTVLVRFWNGVPPCSGARVTVAESADRVEVTLETGANANAATMTCIALAGAYEIAIPLSAPLGDRQLVATSPLPVEDPGPIDAEFAVDYYVGLTVVEAEDLAAVEGRGLRFARIDDEIFALTQDFIPSRINVEVDDGVVSAAYGG